jgi:hypothetical protein
MASAPARLSSVKIIVPPPGTLKHYANDNSNNTAIDLTDVGMDTPGVFPRSPTMTAATTATAHHSINQISVSTERTEEPPLPNINAHILPTFDNECDIDLSPPKLVGGMESWGAISETLLEEDDSCRFQDTSLSTEALTGKRRFHTLQAEAENEMV